MAIPRGRCAGMSDKEKKAYKQGWKDRENERLSAKTGKISSKDFKGTKKQKQAKRRKEAQASRKAASSKKEGRSPVYGLKRKS